MAAGFRPAGVALAVAAAFMSVGNCAFGQPAGAQAIHGQASLVQQGNSLVVTTQNGPGTNHSAINWQSFSVPGGTITQFRQPDASSTSINRVMGKDPSAIYGTLSSNGRLVLVNPSGIAVGAGAVVDTAGFTASTLRMSDADALAGRLRFGDSQIPIPATLRVDGTVIGRNGDVVLIGPRIEVGHEALMQAANGATLLLAGQKVELTGRGLEGIRFELQAPADQAVNLGTLQGDAVAIFAGQLKHSGVIQATGVTSSGGKVILTGRDSARIDGSVAAVQGRAGGQVLVTADNVSLESGAVIDASGETGGGEVLIGGGWQGRDARLANARNTLVDAGATVKADATRTGDGGTIVAWSDGQTRVAGSLSARGGAGAGDGGRIETSGHVLDMQATVDTAAPNGRPGTLLLDPDNVFIALSASTALVAGMSTGPELTPGATYVGGGSFDSLVRLSSIQGWLNGGTSVLIKTSATPANTGTGNIVVVDPVSWTSSVATSLDLWADKNITLKASITGAGYAGNTLGLRSEGGTISQDIASVSNIMVPLVRVSAPLGSVLLSRPDNSVSTIAGDAGGTGGAFTFVNAGPLTVGSVTSASGTSDGIVTTGNSPVSLTAKTGDLIISNVTNGINPGFGAAVTLEATNGSVTQDPSTSINANSLTVTAGQSIDLQGANTVNLFSASQTSSTGGSIAFNASGPFSSWTVNDVSQAALGPSSVFISSSGFNTIFVTGPVTAGPASSLNISTPSLSVQPAATLTAGSIHLTADNMYLFSAAGSIKASGGDIRLEPMAAARPIALGYDPDTSSVLQLGATEIDALSTTGVVGIGTTASGSVIVGGPIASTAGTLSIKSGGTITQDVTGTITASKLSVEALKGADLSTAANSVTDLAAQVGDATNKGYNFKFANSGDLNIQSGLDGLSGVSTSFDTTGGVITLKSDGALTQASTAWLGGSAVSAQGSSVTLTAANPTGVIAGTATGKTATDAFQYTSSNAIFVTTVDGMVGVTANAIAPSPAPTVPPAPAIALAGSSIGQDVAAPITTGMGLKLTTSGTVTLTNSSNSVAAIGTGGATGAFNFHQSGPIEVGLTDTGAAGTVTLGVSSSNVPITIDAGGGVQVSAPIDAGTGGVTLTGAFVSVGGTSVNGGSVALKPIGDISVDQSVLTAADGGISLITGSGEVPNITVTASTLKSTGGPVTLQASLGKVQVSDSVVSGTSISMSAQDSLDVSGSRTSTTASLDAQDLLSLSTSAANSFVTIDGASLHSVNGNVEVKSPSGSVAVTAASITAGGAIVLDGSGTEFTSVSATVAAGVFIDSATLSTGAGNIDVLAHSDMAAVSTSTVSTTGGSISINGGDVSPSGSSGVQVYASTVSAGSAGTVTIAGSTTSTSSPAVSVLGGGAAAPAAAISGGTVSITGTTAGGLNALLASSAVISATNSAQLTSIGGNLSLFGTTVQNAGSGAVRLEARSAATPAPTPAPRIVVDSTSVLKNTSGSGEVQIAADSVQLDGNIDSGAARSVFTPASTERGISIGGTDDISKLALSESELNRVKAGAIVVGGTGFSGGISIDTPIGSPVPVSLTTSAALSLIQGAAGTITQSSGAPLKVNQLNVEAGSVVLGDNNAVQTISGRASSEFLFFNDAGTGLVVGAVDKTDGIQSGVAGAFAPVSLRTSGGLTQTSAISGSSVALAAGLDIVIANVANSFGSVNAGTTAGRISLVNSNAGSASVAASAAGTISYQGTGAAVLNSLTSSSSAAGTAFGTAAVSVDASSISAPSPAPTSPPNIGAPGSVYLRAGSGSVGSLATPLAVNSSGGVVADATADVYLSTQATSFAVTNLMAGGNGWIAGPGGAALSMQSAHTGGSFGWSGFSLATLGSGLVDAVGGLSVDGDLLMTKGAVLWPGAMTLGTILELQSGAQLAFNLGHDAITVTGAGNVDFQSGSTVLVNAATQPANGVYTLIGGSVSATPAGVLPALSGNIASASLKFGSLLLNVAVATPAPTPAPTAAPTPAPTAAPTPAPTAAPTPAPTAAPTPAPTAAPTPAPTAAPTPAPTAAPTPAPTAAPTPAPTAAPTPAPTLPPVPTPSPTPAPVHSSVDLIAVLLAGDMALAEQVASEMTSTPLTTFVTLMIEEQQKEKEKDKTENDRRPDGNVVDDSGCRRGA